MLMETFSAYYRIGSMDLAAVVYNQVPKSKAWKCIHVFNLFFTSWSLITYYHNYLKCWTAT